MLPASPLGVAESCSVGDKFGDRSWEAIALAEPGGDPRPMSTSAPQTVVDSVIGAECKKEDVRILRLCLAV
jgi:hypothetical protein